MDLLFVEAVVVLVGWGAALVTLVVLAEEEVVVLGLVVEVDLPLAVLLEEEVLVVVVVIVLADVTRLLVLRPRVWRERPCDEMKLPVVSPTLATAVRTWRWREGIRPSFWGIFFLFCLGCCDMVISCC